jgi:hypothetical protein
VGKMMSRIVQMKDEVLSERECERERQSMSGTHPSSPCRR